MKTSTLNIDDQDDVSRLRNSDRAAFEEIYNRHWHFLYTSVFRVLRHQEDAMDICQNVFLSLWEHRERLVLKTNLRAYLFGAVKYQTANLIRRGSARMIYTDDLSNLDTAGDEVLSIEVKELKNYLDNLIHSLPPKQREVFLMSRRDYLTHREIAQKMGISEKTVDDHISRALKKMRDPLKKLSVVLITFL